MGKSVRLLLISIVFAVFNFLSSSILLPQNETEICSIVKCRGKTTIITKENEEKKPGPGCPLSEGDRLCLEKNAMVTLIFRSGKKTFWGPDTIKIGADLENSEKPIVSKGIFRLISQKLENSANAIRSYSGAVRSSDMGSSTFLLSPRNSYICYEPIKISWTSPKGSPKTVVQVFEANLGQLIFTRTISDTVLFLSPDSLNLVRGQRYRIQIGSGVECWDSCWFKIYTLEQERKFLLQEHQFMQHLKDLGPIGLITFYENNMAYAKELEFLYTLISLDPNDPLYYSLLADLFGSKLGAIDLARRYSRLASVRLSQN